MYFAEKRPFANNSGKYKSGKLNRSGQNFTGVGQIQISRVNILAPWAKQAQNGGENEDVFSVTGTMNLFSLLRDRSALNLDKNVNRYFLLNLNRINIIMKIFP